MNIHSHQTQHLAISDGSESAEGRLWWAVGANMLLTLGQVVGGVLSGSLSLIADALHNFSDAASLLIALVAIRIGRKPPDEIQSFGYKRAETIAALINLTSLILIGLYLVLEAIKRFIRAEPVEGLTVIVVAVVALLVDLVTAFLTFARSKQSMNIKAVFLHNLADALASLGVIVAGVLIAWRGWLWTDAAMTLAISGYVLWQSYREMPKVIRLLMEGTPQGLEIGGVAKAMRQVEGVKGIHHVHIWQIDEDTIALEAHVVLQERDRMDEIKIVLKNLLLSEFKISHSTLEFENNDCSA